MIKLRGLSLTTMRKRLNTSRLNKRTMRRAMRWLLA